MGKKDRGVFFTATPVKFILLSLCTFGLYEFAWFYGNWRRIRERTGRGLSPAWRATFPPLYAWPLFRDIDTAAQERGILQNLHPVVLTALYVLLWIPALMASPWKFIKLLTVVPLLMMNNLARRTCRAADPEWEENGRIGFGAMIVVFFGSLMLAASLGGAWLDATGALDRYLENSPYAHMFTSKVMEDR